MSKQDTGTITEAQFNLLLDCLPIVAQKSRFSLKVGTAISLFLCNFPRISVDIDLIYQPIEARDISLRNIDEDLKFMSTEIQKLIPNVQIKFHHVKRVGTIDKVYISSPPTTDREFEIMIKIEVHPMVRGSVFPPQFRQLQPKVPYAGEDFAMNVASMPDVYAGKFHAALKRQHPRDLFDMHEFFKHFEITDDIRTAFIVYLLSEKSPPGDLLAPNPKDVSELYEVGLVNLMKNHVTLDELYAARERLNSEIVNGMSDNHKEFVRSFYAGNPDWSLLDVANADKFPAVKWKMLNLEKVSDEKRKQILQGIDAVF